MDSPFVSQAEMLLLRGAFAEALNVARIGLTLNPDLPELLTIAASCASRLGEDALAVGYWQRLLQLDPLSAEAGNQLGLLLERLQRPDEAEAAFRQALQILPDDANLHANLGLLLENRQRFDEAELHQRLAAQLAPDSGEIHSNLAGLLARRGREEEAEALYRQAIQLEPEFAIGHSNLGVLLTLLGRDAEAESSFREALRLQPDNLQARMNLAQFLLAQGRYREGWPLYEARQQVYGDAGSGPVVYPPACPQWQGESLIGKSIVVLPEQGLGDEIQFCRYLPWLKAQGASRVTLVCRPAQKALLATLAGPDALFDLLEAAPQIDGHDYWTFLLSLPLYAGTELASIPATVPYLSPDPQRVERLAPWLAGNVLKVGVVWRGNPQHSNDAERSLPGLDTLAPLWKVHGVSFFSLQKPPADLPSRLPIVDLAPAIEDFADTAALLSQLDLLVCVDTSVAHLAGALGLPCWLLLPRYKTDWRWLQGRSDSPWYPATRLFRQTRRGDWSAPVAELAAVLQVWAQAKNQG